MKNDKFNPRVNHQIRAEELRVLGIDGKQIGVMKLSEALAQAHKVGLDLIEIAPKARPPVVKIADLGKFRYEQEKKLKKDKKKIKSGELKEIRFSPFIAKHDYQVRIERIKEFLDEKNKVRATVVFKGRHMGSKRFGYELLKNVVKDLGLEVSIDMEPKFVGRHLQMVISPTGKIKKQEKDRKTTIKKNDKKDKTKN